MFSPSRFWLRLPTPVVRRAQNYPHFDLCIIGSGPAGLAAAMRAVHHKRERVCIVEAHRAGGGDVWGGTLQSKALWGISRRVAEMMDPNISDRFLDPAVRSSISASIDDKRIREYLRELSETKERRILAALKDAGVHFIQGKASFSNPHEIDIHTEGTGEYRSLTSDYFIIATGSSPRQHPLRVADGKTVVTSDHIFHLPVPKSLVIIGAGSLGCEFASMYASLGTTQVSLIDKARRVMEDEDDDVAEAVQRSLLQSGVEIHHSSVLFDLDVHKGEDGSVASGCQYSVQNRSTGHIETFDADMALVAVGRVPNYGSLELRNAGMRVKDGYLDVDAYNRCRPHEHIYCIGDAGRNARAVNVAHIQGRAAVDDMFSFAPRNVVNRSRINNITVARYFNQELALVGLGENECRERRIGYIVAKLGCDHIARAALEGDRQGFIKVLVTNDEERRVLGVRAMCPHAGSIVEVASLAIRNGDSIYKMARLNAPYPSMASGLEECARLLVGQGSEGSIDARKFCEDDIKSTPATSLTVYEWTPEECTRGRSYCGKPHKSVS